VAGAGVLFVVQSVAGAAVGAGATVLQLNKGSILVFAATKPGLTDSC
jgi:hypothetical protein